MLQGEQVNLVKDFDRTIYTYRDGKLSPRYSWISENKIF